MFGVIEMASSDHFLTVDSPGSKGLVDFFHERSLSVTTRRIWE